MVRNSFLLVLALLASMLPCSATQDVVFLRAGRFIDARKYLEQAIERDPQSASLHSNLGIALLHLRDYHAAHSHLARATTLQPDLAAAWLNLAGCFICLGEFGRAVDAYRRVESLTPASSTSLEPLITFLNSAKKIDETSSDYFVPTWRRWGAGSTVKLYVAPDPRYKQIAIQAMRDIVSNLNGKLQLEIVSSKSDANITCEWLTPPHGSMVLERGVASGIAKNGKIVGSAVVIFLSNESGLDFLSDETVSKSCLHEFMHALGVADHSANVEDIMFPMLELPTVEPRLSQRDKATVRHLYTE
jgi:hypothetical protein